jgi:hypothetical protein
MLMKRHADSPETIQAEIAAFLDAHYAKTHSNDIGPLLGVLSSMRDEAPVDGAEQRLWNEAVSLALTGQAAPQYRLVAAPKPRPESPKAPHPRGRAAPPRLVGRPR